MQSGKRILGLDVLKVFCISFIVLLHTGVLRDCFSINLDPICRFAVPCFFMVTGFFYHSSVNNKREVLQIKKVIILIIIANVVLITLNVFVCLLNRNSVLDWLLSCVSKGKVLRLLVFNEDLISGSFDSNHIWYLNALLYVLGIAYVFRKIGIFKVLYYLTPFLLIGGFVVECFSQQLFGTEFSAGGYYCYYRNFLTVGIPYFCIGNIIWRFNLEKIRKYRFILLVLSIILLCVSFLEFRVELNFSLCTNGEFFIVTPFYSIGIFLFFYSAFYKKKINRLTAFIALIGERYVVWIYLFHFSIIQLVGYGLSFCKLPYDFSFIVLPVLSLLISLFVGVAVDVFLIRKKKRT